MELRLSQLVDKLKRFDCIRRRLALKAYAEMASTVSSPETPKTPEEEKETPEPPTPGGDLLPELGACKALLVKLGTARVLLGGVPSRTSGRGEGEGR